MSTHSVQSAWWLCWNSCRFFLNGSSCYASKMPCLQIDEFEAGSPDACNEACFNNVLCQYYTYSPDSTDCLLYNSCQISEDVCDDCLTSEVACTEEEGIFIHTSICKREVFVCLFVCLYLEPKLQEGFQPNLAWATPWHLWVTSKYFFGLTPPPPQGGV